MALGTTNSSLQAPLGIRDVFKKMEPDSLEQSMAGGQKKSQRTEIETQKVLIGYRESFYSLRTVLYGNRLLRMASPPSCPLRLSRNNWTYSWATWSDFTDNFALSRRVD